MIGNINRTNNKILLYEEEQKVALEEIEHYTGTKKRNYLH